MKRLLLSLILTIGFSSPAFAEEVVQEEVGGWAVVNPETNQVHGVIVCTESVCGSTGSWGGVLPGEYMGCTNCSLKFQTKATDDGNVAGWHGENVTYKPEDETFEMTNNYSTDDGDVEQVMVVTPSQTASDGKDLYTGVQTKTKLKTKAVNNQTAVVELTKESSQDVVVPVKVQYEQWNGGTSFFYESVDQLESNIDADVESVFTPCDTCNADPEQVEEYRNAFYETITTLTTKVKDFIASLFGGI
jgi:hypothetical protein